MPLTRLLDADDAAALAALLQESRSFLAPWQPIRPDRYYSEAGQHEAVEKALEGHAAGGSVPLVIRGESGAVVGTVTLPHNRRSQRVLGRVGFVQYGAAASYLHIAGEWQDHRLYQLLTPTPERVRTA